MATHSTEERPTCPRCDSFLRLGQDDPDGLCDPCRATVDSCAPFMRPAPVVPDALVGPAPANANILELAGGLLLLHDALHPGQPLNLRKAVGCYGVDLDRITVRQIVRKLGRRHGIIAAGESRTAGYAVKDWTWEARRVRSSRA